MQPTTPAPRFAFGPRNYRLMWAGLIILAVGFITMMLDKADYGEGFLGITLGPILLVVGFVLEFAAIMVRSNPGPEVPVAPAHPGVAAPITAPTAAAPVVPPPAPVAAPAKPTYKRL